MDRQEVFDKIVGFTLQFEGGFVDDPDDAGGATNFGWTLATARGTRDLDIFDQDGDGDIDRDDIKAMDRDDAIRAYQKYFYEKYEFDKFSDKIGFIMFDMGVNHGPKRAIILLQRALNKSFGDIFEEDGVLSIEVIEAAASANEDQLIEDLNQVRRDFYRAIVAKKPTQAKFLKGWLRRVALIEEALLTF